MAGAAKPAAPPADAKPPGEGLAKKLAEEKAAAPAPPPAPAKAEPKPAEAPREQAFALKEMDKAANLKGELQQNKQNDNGTSRFTVGSPQVAATRAQAREVLAKWSVDFANAGPAPTSAPAKTAGTDAGFIAVELTPSQFAELKKQLEATPGVRLAAGGPEDAAVALVFRADRGPAGRAGGQAAGKPAEDPKRGAEVERKQEAQGKADSDAKDRQADKAKESKPPAAPAPVQAQAERPQKYILYFVEVTPIK